MRIAQNRSHVVTPHIEAINDETIEVEKTPIREIQVSVFDWALTQSWRLNYNEQEKRKQGLVETTAPMAYVNARLELSDAELLWDMIGRKLLFFVMVPGFLFSVCYASSGLYPPFSPSRKTI